MMIVFPFQYIDVQRHPPRRRQRTQEMPDILTREATDYLALQAERDVGKRPPGEIDDRPCQCLIERREGPAETVDPTPLSQRAVERLSQGERTILGGMVIVDLQVPLARELQGEPRVATQGGEEMIGGTGAPLSRR